MGVALVVGAARGAHHHDRGGMAGEIDVELLLDHLRNRSLMRSSMQAANFGPYFRLGSA